jgi:hypothetical protein
VSERLRAIFAGPERIIGFRGTALLLFALTYIAIAFSIPYSPVQPALYHTHLPSYLRVMLWLGCATLAILAVFLERPKWHGRGFGALLLPAGERFTSYTGGVIFDGPNRFEYLSAAAVYGLLCTILLLIAAWPEPVDSRHHFHVQKVR